MPFRNNQTAILYFTRSAEEEARAKTFCSSGNFAQNRAIAEKLIDHTYRQIQYTSLPVNVFTPDKQKGDTFGEKLGNAFQSLFAEGYENVIAVGNDCLQLSAATIRYSAQLLKRKSLVAGPTADGGTYLIGISRHAFCKKAFIGLAWETDCLLDDFSRYAEYLGYKLARLIPSVDVDNEGGLRRFLRQAKGLVRYHKLIAFILSVINISAGRYIMADPLFTSFHCRLQLFHRGPPVS